MINTVPLTTIFHIVKIWLCLCLSRVTLASAGWRGLEFGGVRRRVGDQVGKLRKCSENKLTGSCIRSVNEVES